MTSATLLSIQLSIDPDIIRHPKNEQRQITLSVNDLTISCRVEMPAAITSLEEG